MTRNELEYQLEELIDKTSLTEVLQALVVICQEKEDHVLTNWQDKPLADSWAQDAKLIDKIASKAHN